MRSQMLRFLISFDGISTIDGLLQNLRNEMEANEPAAIPSWYKFRKVTMDPRKIGYDGCSNWGCDKIETLERKSPSCSICEMSNYCKKWVFVSYIIFVSQDAWLESFKLKRIISFSTPPLVFILIHFKWRVSDRRLEGAS